MLIVITEVVHGKNIMFPTSGKFWVNNHAHIIEETASINLTYLEFYLNIKDVRSHVTGIDQFKLNRTSMDAINIFKPPMDIQIEFESIVMLSRSNTARKIESVNEVNSLFNSLSQKAFKGIL